MSAEQQAIVHGPRPFADLRATGLLWLINRQVLHPRGWALALHFDNATGEATGWSLMGDGIEPWNFKDGEENDLLAAVNETLQPLDDADRVKALAVRAIEAAQASGDRDGIETSTMAWWYGEALDRGDRISQYARRLKLVTCTACDSLIEPNAEAVPDGDRWAHRDCMEAGE